MLWCKSCRAFTKTRTPPTPHPTPPALVVALVVALVASPLSSASAAHLGLRLGCLPASCVVHSKGTIVVRAFLFCFEERLFSSHLPLCTVALPLCDLNRDRICACACAFCIFLSGSELPPAVSSSRAGAMWRADGELRVAMLLLLIVTCVPPAGSFGGLTYLRKPAASEAGPELEFHQEAMSRTADSVYKMPVRSRHGPRTQRRTRAIRACAHARCPYHPSSHPPRCRTAIHTACKRTSTGGGAARRVRHSRRRFQ